MEIRYVKMQCKETLCWDCKNFAGNCSWSREFKPVDGWRAKKITINVCAKKRPTITSYIVFECPQYIDDD